MGVFSDILRSDETIFKNVIALDYDYIPKLVPFREVHQRHMASCITPLFQDRSGRNLFIHGPPGVGKTVACRHVLKEIEDEHEEIEPIYINCWEKNTTHKIMTAICDSLGYKFTQNKKSDEMMKIIKEILNKKSVVFVFDEIDKAEEHDFLYWILEQIYKKAVFLITNYKEWLLNMDERIKSRLTAEILEFKQYNLPETKEIISQRIGHAFRENVVEKDAFDAIVKKTYDMGDLRKGLYLLKEAGNLAEERSLKHISIDQITTAVKKLDEFTINKMEGLDDDERFVFEVVKKYPDSKTGDLYKYYMNSGGKGSQKTFTRKLAKLSEGRFITMEKVGGGAEGNTSIIKLASRQPVNKKITEF
ncbi:AAA family ATPase [Candidatus Woesearchaeota archaeon]|nr:AAA family ATPase [Candidatus Woesearchaeota archaeon]